jgi:hypothetical protein
LLPFTGWAGEDPLDRKEQLDVASAHQRTPKSGSDRILFARDQLLEQRPVGTHYAICTTLSMRDREITKVDGHQEVIDFSISVGKIKPDRATHLAQQWLVSLLFKLLKEPFDRVRHDQSLSVVNGSPGLKLCTAGLSCHGLVMAQDEKGATQTSAVTLPLFPRGFADAPPWYPTPHL